MSQDFLECRVLLNSQTNPGYVRMTLTQAGAVPY